MKKSLLLLSLLIMPLLGFGQTMLVDKYAFTGKFKGKKITISLWFEETANGELAGELVYTSSKKNIPIRVFGYSFKTDDGDVYYYLTEYQPDGDQTGTLTIIKDKKGLLKGEWSEKGKFDEARKYDVSVAKAVFPNGKGGLFTYSSEPDGEYTYNYKHLFKGDQGGHVIISLLRGNPQKMTVKISKYDPNLADFEENLFFKNGCFKGGIEDCGYKFVVHVFKDFVMVRTESNQDSYDCFGAHTTLDGFYMKRK